MFGFSLVSLACGSSSVGAEDASDPSLTTEQEEIDLTDLAVGRTTIFADVGDRVEVVVRIQQGDGQQGGELVQCARPAVIDALGNTLAVLSPKVWSPGEDAFYRFAFYAAAAGHYGVELDNDQCDEARTQVKALVTWTRHEQ